MTCRFLIGDVHERLVEIPDGSVDFLVTSPPFLALRSYLPEGHPDKGKEIGSDPTPAAFIDVLLNLTAEWGRVLAPHGSIAVELGDTYAGSGGAGGDYNPDGLRDGQPRFKQRNDGGQYGNWPQGGTKHNVDLRPVKGAAGWPLAKSLACIPQLYQVALAYGINPLTSQPSPAGRWRVRNLKPWIRSNPPVGALGDKERPATSYVVVACRASDRWFDLDAVRTPHAFPDQTRSPGKIGRQPGNTERYRDGETLPNNAGGAPPRDWWHHVDAVLDTELAARRQSPPTHARTKGTQDRSGKSADRGGNWSSLPEVEQLDSDNTTGAQGVHLRRALERAGILTTLEALDVSPKGYSGAHYAVWPPELVRLLVDEMCPRRVCTTCGQPSRRIVDSERHARRPQGESFLVDPAERRQHAEQHGYWAAGKDGGRQVNPNLVTTYATVGWSDCGHNTWRPGHVLDPFAGSGTTLAVATGMGRTATGIDIDERNADLARQRCGMFLDIDAREVPA